MAQRGCTRLSRDHLLHQAMELTYIFDPEKWYLGTLCIHGHKWPGTDLSIRRLDKRSPRCAGCAAMGKQSLPWLFKFIDQQASGVPDGLTLGKLCKEGHSWKSTGYSLRRSSGHCVECGDKYRDPEKRKAICRRYYLRNKETLREQSRDSQRRRRTTPQYREYLQRTRDERAEYKRQQRAKAGADTYGPRELIKLHAAIKRAGRLPSVARLVYEQQREHWREHPSDRDEFLRQYAQWRHHWNYAMSLTYRLYHRSKSKKRKAQQRGSTAFLLSPDQLWRRWVDFNHTCAYCGAGGDLQIEHVIPISKGGEHHLGNIVPACQRCNFSKGKADALTWYQSQSFFDETRWQRIQNLLARSQPGYEQPSLL